MIPFSSCRCVRGNKNIFKVGLVGTYCLFGLVTMTQIRNVSILTCNTQPEREHMNYVYLIHVYQE